MIVVGWKWVAVDGDERWAGVPDADRAALEIGLRLAESGGDTVTVVTVGGPVEELHVTLALYGDDLDPVEISTVLGCQPTSSHQRGETRIGRKTGRKVVYKQVRIEPVRG